MAGIHPIILSGGFGTRLWPVSRKLYPKQFIHLLGDECPTPLGATLRRLPSASGFAPPIIICNHDHRFMVREELEAARLEPAAVILEPVGRNTAPAAAVAALQVLAGDAEAIVVLMPSDHRIADTGRFRSLIEAAADLARAGHFVLFGARPDRAHTGYGYIRCGAPLGRGDAFRVDAFIEKPELAVAESYLAEGRYLWNSGIFVLPARRFLDELGRLSPEVPAAAERALAAARPDVGFLRLDEPAFAAAPAISIDHAVMERTTLAVVLPFDVGWSDLGAWSSIWEAQERDAGGNAAIGDVVLDASSGCLVSAGPSLVAAIGVEDLVIVNTADAVLVTRRDRAEAVGGLVKRLQSEGRPEVVQHLRDHRPWGHFDRLATGDRYQVKRLCVKPGGRLSLQMHHHRSEHWVVVRGTGKVTSGAKVQLLREGESIFIPATEWHRLENTGKLPLEIIEVQTGAYLGEDDIVRSDDVYERGQETTPASAARSARES